MTREIYLWVLYSGCISFSVLFFQFGVVWKTLGGALLTWQSLGWVLSPKCPDELEEKGGTIGGYC